MNKHVLAAVVGTAMMVATAEAGVPKTKNRRQAKKTRPAVKRTVKKVRPQFDRSPEKMTERFGPSILLREQAEAVESSKFVTQPK